MNADRRSLVLDEFAIEDLSSIADYIIELAGLPKTAHAFIDRIEARCEKLIDFPLIGRDASEVLPDLRLLPFESVLICYTVDDKYVRILRILGRGQDVGLQFSQR